MIVLAGAIFGALLGASIAKRRKGRRLDMMQYAAVYAIAFALLGTFATIAIHRMAV